MFKPPECGCGHAIHCPSIPQAVEVKPQVCISSHYQVHAAFPNISGLMHPVVISEEINSLTKPLLLSHIFKHEPVHTRCAVTQRDITFPGTAHSLLMGTASMNC